MVYNYDKYISMPDFLNNVVAAFPGSGVVLGTNVQTGQLSNRFAGTLSLRSQFGSHVTNEWRGGLNGGTVLFFPDVSPGLYSYVARLPADLRLSAVPDRLHFAREHGDQHRSAATRR